MIKQKLDPYQFPAETKTESIRYRYTSEIKEKLQKYLKRYGISDLSNVVNYIIMRFIIEEVPREALKSALPVLYKLVSENPELAKVISYIERMDV